MQILGHSVIPVTPVPYLHLGYMSAYVEKVTTVPPGFEHFFGYGLFITIISLAVFLYTRQFSSRAKYIPLVFLAAGIGMLVIPAIFQVPPRLAYPEATLSFRMSVLCGEINDEIDAGKPVPTSVYVLALKNRWRTDDIWGTPFRIMPEKMDDDSTVYAIVSAGEDRKFGTKDDRREYSQPLPPEKDHGDSDAAGGKP